ncbi:MAG: TonB-dependent receptor [Phenylobacterium sp.]|uniref:TonB-dependent receptor n=1 Tax=Phenylobacterium sp. TaxID=1871053 RepID=UPI0027342467|nr:TonB-dependent receptor [Phenylobacterium sp.]MDP3175261.1 TonB-dependent receptor [Phenylobacterium sp.]
MPWRLVALGMVLACFAPQAAFAQQRSAENATRSADDAFGVSVGNEKVGLYNERDTRGFSPLSAGNLRIEGLYYDLRLFLPTRALASTTIRVGLTAQSYPFPAPTGIVDYALRTVDDRNSMSGVLQVGPNNGFSAELDVQRQIIPGKLGISAGLYQRIDDSVPGDSTSSKGSVGVVTRWRPMERTELTGFFTYGGDLDNKFNPFVFTSGPFLPPKVRPKFFGQDWSLSSTYLRSYGVLGFTPVGDHWTLKAGLFRHSTNGQGAIADLYLNTDRAGLPAQHVVTNDRPFRTATTSGEARLTGVFAGDRLRQTVHLSVRGRNAERNFGGAASASILPIPVGRNIGLPEPAWVYGPQSQDQVRQWAVGAQYQLAWRKLGEVSFGAQRVDYEKTVTPALARPTVTQDKPTFFNASAALNVSKRIAIYAGTTQGLEEVPLAPENAANAQEAPPAIHTSQYDFGVRYAITPTLRLVLGYFNVEKPYFNLDPSRIYRNLGDEQHKGYEISLAGAINDRLNIVAGVVLQKPSVSGEGVDRGLIGPKPVSQPETTVRLNLDYRTPWVQGLSIDAAVNHTGERAATSREFAELGGAQLNAEAYTTLDLGMRYRFRVRDHASMLRVQIQNIFDDFTWKIYPSGAFYVTNPRNILVSVATDF